MYRDNSLVSWKDRTKTFTGPEYDIATDAARFHGNPLVEVKFQTEDRGRLLDFRALLPPMPPTSPRSSELWVRVRDCIIVLRDCIIVLRDCIIVLLLMVVLTMIGIAALPGIILRAPSFDWKTQLEIPCTLIVRIRYSGFQKWPGESARSICTASISILKTCCNPNSNMNGEFQTFRDFHENHFQNWVVQHGYHAQASFLIGSLCVAALLFLMLGLLFGLFSLLFWQPMVQDLASWPPKFAHRKLQVPFVISFRITGIFYRIESRISSYSVIWQVAPGENVIVHVQALDQLNHSVYTVVSMVQQDSTSPLLFTSDSMHTLSPFDNNTLPLAYRVASNHVYHNLNFSAEYEVSLVDFSSTLMNGYSFFVQPKRCLPGFTFVKTKCKCNNKIEGVLGYVIAWIA